MLCLGLDLGSLQTGWALIKPAVGKHNYNVVGSGTFIEKPRDNISYDVRCYTMGQYVASLLELNPTIEKVFIEDVYVGRNSKTIIKLGQLRGVISALCIEIGGIEPSYINTMTIKKTIGMSGKSSKDDIARMVEAITRVKTRTLDESDAMATAIAGHLLDKGQQYERKWQGVSK